ncbi:checkpoint protein HUS1 isoform X3 [Hyla sarda]|uniref:checkpoint protein HUS1 isoform X3 n=1 Tax=Hyla sarda TaxID=327740 RepID=UPI0024C42171|nr:checkpoint protein HUS1 isoform X3 [Hyla sarda]XP_056376221.1 checkpoint protein HUS1 isoform X3 [Hyla sarda]
MDIAVPIDGVVNTITKLTKSCNLRLTANNLYFILTDKVANGGVSMWCELCQTNFFDEYQMEGVSAEQNEIYLELAPENLSRALKTAQNAKAVKIKLTNKHCPCLTVAVELPSLSSTSRIVTHDIPVTVIPRRLWNDFKEPTVPHFDVSIYLPALKTMKSVVERMKNVSNFIVIEANRNGEMNLKIETDLASVSTHFKDLGNPPWVSDEPSQSDPDIMSEARVDIRKLLQFLAGQQVNPNKAICTVLLQAMFLLLPCPSAISCQRPLDTLMLLWISSVPQEVLYINGWSTLSYYMMMCPCSISFLLLPRWIHLVI